MIQGTIFTLVTLHFKRGDRRNQGSEPYYQLAKLQPEQTKGISKVSTPSVQHARVVIRESQPGGTGGDPNQPGFPPEFPAETNIGIENVKDQ